MQPNMNKQYITDLIGQKATPTHAWMLYNTSGRVGTVCSNLSLFLLFAGIIMCIAVMISGLLTAMFALLIILVAILAIIFTLGLILLAMPEEWDKMLSTQEFLATMTGKLGIALERAAPFVLIGATLLALVSIPFLVLDKSKKHIARIVMSSLVVAIGLVAAIIAFA